MAHVALYSPYIPKHKGGGEKYLLSIAEVTSRRYPTSLLVPASLVEATKTSLSEYEAIFGLDLSKVSVLASGVGSSKGPIRTALSSKQFSHLFAMTDGSIFPSFAGKSYFIAQVPWARKLSVAESIKLTTWTKVLVYSDFVREVIVKSWKPPQIQVLSPYVNLSDFKPGKKEPIILNVGRFFRHTTSNSKRQDIVIKVFKRLVEKGVLTGYSLVLAGNVDPNPDSEAYINELRDLAFGYHVNIVTNISYSQLRSFYAKALIYCHAAGFGINPQSNPENTEHFGMTTLEAMASGCIPLVVPYGGQKEIVNDSHLFWETEDQLSEKISQLIHAKKDELNHTAKTMQERAEKFSKEKFVKAVEALL